jgi:hypothetical protein
MAFFDEPLQIVGWAYAECHPVGLLVWASVRPASIEVYMSSQLAAKLFSQAQSYQLQPIRRQ